MRQVVLDTETTGLEVRQGERIIEIGCVEIANRRLTGRRFHTYLQPDREIQAGAMAVHGITNEFLLDKPRFAQVAQEFLGFIEGAELVIHNAAFDIGFLNNELALTNLGAIDRYTIGVVDSLLMAREMNPGRRNSLDALCERYEIDNSGRTLHGALLDAELLAEVFLAMTRGQESLIIELEPSLAAPVIVSQAMDGAALRVLRADADELAAHAALVAMLGKESKAGCVWNSAPSDPQG